MKDDLLIANGDTAAVPITVVDEYGVPVDLTGATVTFYATRESAFWGRTWPMDAATPDAADVKGATCTPDTDQAANTGLCLWTPVAADTDTAGVFAAQVRVVYSGGGVRHYPPRLGDRVLIVGAGLNP